MPYPSVRAGGPGDDQAWENPQNRPQNGDMPCPSAEGPSARALGHGKTLKEKPQPGNVLISNPQRFLLELLRQQASIASTPRTSSGALGSIACTPTGTRTLDLQIKSLQLCQLSYRGEAAAGWDGNCVRLDSSRRGPRPSGVGQRRTTGRPACRDAGRRFGDDRGNRTPRRRHRLRPLLDDQPTPQVEPGWHKGRHRPNPSQR